jgi:hypothetical protein
MYRDIERIIEVSGKFDITCVGAIFSDNILRNIDLSNSDYVNINDDTNNNIIIFFNISYQKFINN